MISIPASLPDDETLRRGLASILDTDDTGKRRTGVSLLGRENNEYSSTYPSEIVDCQMEDGRILRLYCKYSNEKAPKGQRKGIVHEALVYQGVLKGSTSTTPRYYGVYNDLQKGNKWLVVEHMIMHSGRS